MKSWPMVEFATAVDDVTGGNVKTLQSDYLDEGAYPIVDQGQQRVAGYTNDTGRLVRSAGPLIVFGDHTKCLKYLDEPFALGADGVKVLRPRAGFDAKFAYHYLSTRRLPTAGYSRHFKFLQQISIPRPPIAEQRWLAEVLDRADGLRAKRREALALLDALIQSTYSELFGDPIDNTYDLPTVLLGDVATFVRGITFKPEDVVSGEDASTVQCMRTKNVQRELDMTDVWAVPRRFVRRRDQILSPGDVLVASANSWNLVGRCCSIPVLSRESTFGGFVSVLRAADERLLPEYLYSWFSTAQVQALVRSFGQRTTSISNLNLARCLAMTLPLPDTALQAEYCLQTNAIVEQIAKGRAQIDEMDRLLSSLQQRAFAGEL